MRDYKYERERMVETQIRARGVRDERVLQAMLRVPRHLFVPPEFEDMAYADTPLPIGEGQTISQPYMVAVMTELLEIKETDKVLEIGTGSGYQTAILAELASLVVTVERIETLLRKAERRLTELGYTNIIFIVGDGTVGWKKEAPYQGIIVTAGAPEVPPSLFEQLDEGGRMVIPVGAWGYQTLTLVRKENGRMIKEELFGCTFVPLIGKEGWKENGA